MFSSYGFFIEPDTSISQQNPAWPLTALQPPQPQHFVVIAHALA